MFWVGFNAVFSILGNALYGLFIFIELSMAVFAFSYVCDKIKRFIKRKSSGENPQVGLLFNKHVIVSSKNCSGILVSFVSSDIYLLIFVMSMLKIVTVLPLFMCNPIVIRLL